MQLRVIILLPYTPRESQSLDLQIQIQLCRVPLMLIIHNELEAMEFNLRLMASRKLHHVTG